MSLADWVGLSIGSWNTCKVVVFPAGKAFVAYERFTSQLAQYPNPEIAQVAQLVEQKLEELVAKATGGMITSEHTPQHASPLQEDKQSSAVQALLHRAQNPAWSLWDLCTPLCRDWSSTGPHARFPR